MRRQTSSGCCSAVSCWIQKSKTCSFRAEKDLSNILVWKLTERWRCSARPKLPAETGNQSTSPLRVNHDTLIFGLLCFGGDSHENNHRLSRHRVLKYSPCSPRVRPCSPRVRKSLVLCKEKTLRDEIRVIVIIDTRANCTAKKDRQKISQKVLKFSPEDKAPKTW